MSMKTLSDFVTAMHGDQTLSGGLAAAIRGRQGAEAADAFAAYAREHGFEVTAQDLEAARQAAAGNGALSDDQLDAVSGAGIYLPIIRI